MRINKTKTNGAFFEDIPKIETTNAVLKLLREIYDEKLIRETKVKQAQDLRKEVYNHSLSIAEKYKRVDEFIVKTVSK
jgi:hypothetical protein